MPFVLESKFFVDKDLSLFDSKDVLKNSKKISDFKEFGIFVHYEPISSIYENYISAFLKRSLIGVCEFWFERIEKFKIPRIKNIVIKKEYRSKGIATEFYSILFKKFKALISDCTLNGDSENPGSLGLWKKLIKKHRHCIYNIRTQKIETYSYWKAFRSRDSNRRSLMIMEK